MDLRFSSNDLFKLTEDVDFIYFLAWYVGGTKYLSKNQNSFDFLMNNLKIMKNVFEFLSKTNIPFIFVTPSQ